MSTPEPTEPGYYWVRCEWPVCDSGGVTGERQSDWEVGHWVGGALFLSNLEGAVADQTTVQWGPRVAEPTPPASRSGELTYLGFDVETLELLRDVERTFDGRSVPAVMKALGSALWRMTNRQPWLQVRSDVELSVLHVRAGGRVVTCEVSSIVERGEG